jgi:UDP-glucuronate 4-epimerase
MRARGSVTSVSRFLVTGCAGFIGSHLTDALLARGDDVIGVDVFSDYYERETKESNLEDARANPHFSFVEVDLADGDLEQTLEGVDGVFHLAAQPGVRGSWGDGFARYVRDNVLATQRLFDAMASTGLRVVMASTSSVYGNAEVYPTREDATPRPVSPYGVTKLACESLARTYAECFGLEPVLLRYFSVYGPRQRPDMAFARIIAALLNEQSFSVYGSGEQSRDFTYVGDAVAATLASMDGGPTGIVYNVGGGSERTLNEAIAICERLTSRRLQLVREPTARGDARRTGADTSLIAANLGWSPKVLLEEGLARQLAAVTSASKAFS